MLFTAIPANTTATACIPTSDAGTVREGGRKIDAASGIISGTVELGAAVYELPSGTYHFTAALPCHPVERNSLMLRVIGYQSSVPEAVEVDEWCPLTINWRRATGGAHAWWRTGDDAGNSFLEIGLDRDSGIVCSLSLVLVPLITYLPERWLFPDVPHAPGLPVCDLHRWQDDNYLTDPSPFAVSLHKDCLLIELFPAAVSSVLMAGRTRFGLDAHGNLISVEVVALSEKELWTLREYHTVIGWIG